MEKNWDVKKAEELMIALQECTTIDQLKDLGRGIAILPSSVLSKESRDWLRDIYRSCVVSLSQPPFDPTKVLTKAGVKWHNKNVTSAQIQQKPTT